MGNKIDITGKKFGLLTVLKETTERDINGGIVWKCKCDCGNTTRVPSRSLKTGNTRSCGCLNRKIRDIAGLKFGRLTAVRFTGEYSKCGHAMWECLCDCGETVFINNGNLRRESKRCIKSCGCLLSIPNKYEIKDDHAIIVLTSCKTEKVVESKIDLEDLEKAKKYTWHENNGYLTSRIGANAKKLHRFIMDPPRGLQVDHMNHDTLDNRKSNLRIVTHQQNTMNSSKHRDGTSRHKGVWWRKERSRWVAGIRLDGKLIILGSFRNEDDAALVYNKKAIELFGEYANLNKI